MNIGSLGTHCTTKKVTGPYKYCKLVLTDEVSDGGSACPTGAGLCPAEGVAAGVPLQVGRAQVRRAQAGQRAVAGGVACSAVGTVLHCSLQHTCSEGEAAAGEGRVDGAAVLAVRRVPGRHHRPGRAPPQPGPGAVDPVAAVTTILTRQAGRLDILVVRVCLKQLDPCEPPPVVRSPQPPLNTGL